MNPRAPVPYREAQARLLAMARDLGSEDLALGDALGRFLAEPLLARRTQPAADLSAMDGYAVRADETAGPWRIVGESAAGHPYASSLKPGEAVRTSTGAQMPEGSGAVLLQENGLRDGTMLRPNGKDHASPGHVRRKGLDFGHGDELLAAGTPLTAAQIALALAGGHSSAMVARRPSLAIIDNGDELAGDPADLADHRIPASNGAMLAALAAPFANVCTRIGPVADRCEALVHALEQGGEADVIVTSGGASVGDHDLVRPALEEWGAKLDFWRIAMKPGKPLLVARRGRQIILGLPGNPVSSFVTAWLFLLPLLRQFAGAAEPLPKAISLPVASDLPANGPRATFVRARLTLDGALPLDQQDSSALASLAASDCLIERPVHAPALRKGAHACVFPL